MPSYTIRGLTAEVVSRARQRARDAGTSLDDVLRDYLTRYAESGPANRAGGLARAEALSPEERSMIARKAAHARWHR